MSRIFRLAYAVSGVDWKGPSSMPRAEHCEGCRREGGERVRAASLLSVSYELFAQRFVKRRAYMRGFFSRLTMGDVGLSPHSAP
eukprot:scaffold6999_cov96-Isochrysis_galbana.AAC.3